MPLILVRDFKYAEIQLKYIFKQIICTNTHQCCTPPQELVRSSCENASYPNICIRTLSSYTGPAKTPKDLAQAAVKLSLSQAKRVSNYLAQVSEAEDLKISKRQRGALSDCVEQISESVEELRQTLSELKHLRVETFRWQMSNAETWVSAALTYEDTCLDGFQGVDGNKLKSDVKRKIRNVGKLKSTEALALENGILLASELMIPQVIIESDSLAVVQAVNSRSFHGNMGPIIQGALSLLSQFRSWKVLHLKRDYNKVVHELAQYARISATTQTWIGTEPPMFHSLFVLNRSKC
ncbi:hypothetical protein SO802_030065 [Lithocarpus litseifolius]|uniref:Pectinesterase inhibitor domain-containing protein n=1 Tax=Lithocarpus litseifolius TaxID=425828 RepID=A0AAW2BVG2_9ROSI